MACSERGIFEFLSVRNRVNSCVRAESGNDALINEVHSVPDPYYIHMVTMAVPPFPPFFAMVMMTVPQFGHAGRQIL